MNYHEKVCKNLRRGFVALSTDDRHDAADLIEDLVKENAYLQHRLKNSTREFIIGSVIGIVLSNAFIVALHTYT